MPHLVNSHGYKPDAKFASANSPIGDKNNFDFSNCNQCASAALTSLGGNVSPGSPRQRF